MSNEPTESSKHVLEPHERIAEVLFGLIKVLTFTGSLSIAEAGREDVRTMLIGALGCNLAWGMIDGVFYLMGCLAEKSRELKILRAVRNTADPLRAQRGLADALRLSNLIAVAMLFAAGYSFGRITGGRPWLVGFSMVLLGAVLVALTIALGG